MIVTVASFKGGVGKTTTAVHLAAFLQEDAQTLLIDGDLNRSALRWSERGSLPFRVVDEVQGPMYARDTAYRHVVIDTAARPRTDDLEALADSCDLLVIPTVPDAMSLEAVIDTVAELRKIPSARYKLLLTMVPPLPEQDGNEARVFLEEENSLPLFQTWIRRFKAFRKASLEGVPVTGVKDPRSPDAWRDYTRVGKELLRHE